MKKKIIALVLLIPLLLVFTTFSIAKVVVLTVPIPVVGIDLMMNDVEYLNVADGGKLSVAAKVKPDNAKEQRITYRTEAVAGKAQASLEIDGAGQLRARSLGTARVIATTVDGGYKDSFLVEVGSDKAVGLSFENTSVTLFEGETVKTQAAVKPYSALDKNVTYVSENPAVAKVNPVTGELIGISLGETRIVATLKRGLADNGTDWTEQSLSAIYTVNVKENSAQDILVGGRAGENLVEYADISAEVIVSIRNGVFYAPTAAAQHSVRNARADNPKLTAFYAYAKMQNGTFSAEIITETANKTVFSVTVTPTAAEGVRLTMGATAVEFRNTDRIDALSLEAASTRLIIGEKARLFPSTLPESPKGLDLRFGVSDKDLAEIVEENGEYFLLAKAAGEIEVTVTARCASGAEPLKSTLTFLVFRKPESVNFRIGTKLWGIKERYAFASKKYDGRIEVSDALTLELVSNGTADWNEYDLTTSDSSVAVISGNRLRVLKNGAVTVTAKPKAADALGLGDELSTSFVLDCVDGVNVSDYDALRVAAASGKKIVLQGNVAVGRDISNLTSEEKGNVLADELGRIETTADWSFYKNSGLATAPPSVKVAVEFKNDVFGNGFALNAHNITAVTDSAGLPISKGFNGPLNMVAIQVGTLGAAVKAQDNIVFLVRNDNVKIDNVELIARDLAPHSDGNIDLSDLNYAGTTLEIMGDGVRVVNSRVRNGRTAVRIFGGADSDKKIDVGIESCVLSYAREFILKIGTNKTVASTLAELQPNLTAGGKSYEPRADANWNDKTFVSEFLKTDVTVTNSAFLTSGIFAIGIESKFGGSAFSESAGGAYYFAEWKDASGTPYPARLNLVGNVGLYDWKNIEDIDSSTLIETTIDDPRLSFDIAEILKSVRAKDPKNFGNILSEEDGELYAHGGIAFYGGGKNYSGISTAGLAADSELRALIHYSVSLTAVDGGSILVAAAGTHPFRFFVFDATSSLSHAKQNELLASGKAFEFIVSVKT